MYNKVGEPNNLSSFYLNMSSLNWNTYCNPFFMPQKQVIENNDFKIMYEELKQKYDQLLLQNQQLTVKVQELHNSKKTKRIVNRRRQEDIQREIKCPYDNCNKQYASQVALNLHIKGKHNGGTKKQRQRFAKKILLAEKKHTKLPQQDLKLPPGYLAQFKKTILDHLDSDSEMLYSEQSS